MEEKLPPKRRLVLALYQLQVRILSERVNLQHQLQGAEGL